MSFSTPYTFTALELLTAAKMNAIQANISALWVGTTAGDMDYYSSASAKTRIAIAAEYKVMQVNAAGTAPAWGGLHYASVYHSATQDVNSGSPTALVFNSEAADAQGWHSTSSNTSRITPTKTGQYQASVHFEYAGAGGSGNYYDVVEMRISGNPWFADRRYLEIDANTKKYSNTFPIFSLNAGQYVEIWLEQNSGGTRTISATTAYFSLWRVG